MSDYSVPATGLDDRYAGTAYRFLSNAESAVEMAQFRGSEGAMCFDAGAAITDIDAAIAELRLAREVLAAQIAVVA